MIGAFVAFGPQPTGGRALPVGYVLCEDGCWEWAGKRNDAGYGMVYDRGAMKYRRAHRIFYERHVGTVPDRMELDHLCRNRACVNPAHLEAVTHRMNMLRGATVAAKHAAKVACPYGHPYDQANTALRVGRSGMQRECRICHADRERARRRRAR